ncbi:MAG: tRNA (adenosine(37)-N6)-threonylcarbamoyltransferase complex transferase subunit TsaD [Lachnospiraceae bacterium]|nr:tRNA (adenosine(37)-N6)-threonylcarbamoyltransferase complex transferase subunit TsaD [Lachnospiraceae bacterium]
MKAKDTLILAIESSCDETAAAVVRNGREVLSNIIYSQINIHTMYGGVVPEIASRKHIEKIDPVVASALSEAGVTKEDLSAVAVTAGPGLVGSLLVGVAYAKAYAYAAGLPIIGVHHIEGHIAANYIESKELEPPFLCLVVSGGHTELVVVEDYGKFRLIGTTHDDAAGEAFDKVARAIGLGYPGGPKVDKCAKAGGRPDAVVFPRGHVDGNEFDFSFSGLKSAVLNYLNSCAMKQGGPVKDLREKREGDANFNPDALIDPDTGVTVADVAASFQEAVVDVLVTHTVAAAKSLGISKVAMAGGVAANGALRDRMKRDCESEGISLYYPSPLLCTDNAAMIGCAGYYDFLAGKSHGLDLNAVPGLGLGQSI